MKGCFLLNRNAVCLGFKVILFAKAVERMNIDAGIVILYFVLVLGGGYWMNRKYKSCSDDEFITGGRHLNWKQTGMTLIAMMFDPGVMGNTALAFLWGFYVIQWNAVNVWFTSWFAGLFFVTIYWKSKIVTTPEYLEKRFNAASRAVFSLLMVVMLISFLSYGVYNGGVLLNKFFGWDIFLSVVILISLAGFYVITGGVRTMLAMDVIQGVLLLLTMFAVGITGFILIGGIDGLKAITESSKAGGPLISMIPPLDFDLNTKTLYPLPTIPTFCVIAGLSWIICNFGMAQRLLASKDESHAQKALIVAGVFNVFTLFFAYLAGVAMRKLMPHIEPDASFITMLTTYFPTGIRGLLVVGLMAALLSTIDGLLSSSATLLNQDIYSRFLNRRASTAHLKWVARGIQVAIIGIVLLSVPLFLTDGSIRTEKSAYEILLEFLGSIMGVLIGIFILGVFFKRTTANASFFAMIAGIALGFILPRTTELNFAHVGTMQFLSVIFLGLFFSLFEKKKSEQELENLTIWTIDGVKGPFIGLSSWPGLKWWALALPVAWISLTLLWDFFMVKL